MVYNTEQEIRDACGFPATNPTAAQIARWQTLVDAMIVSYNVNANVLLAAIIEINRLAAIWDHKKVGKSQETLTNLSNPLISYLTLAEKEMLNDADNIDVITTTGKRPSEL